MSDLRGLSKLKMGAARTLPRVTGMFRGNHFRNAESLSLAFTNRSDASEST